MGCEICCWKLCINRSTDKIKIWFDVKSVVENFILIYVYSCFYVVMEINLFSFRICMNDDNWSRILSYINICYERYFYGTIICFNPLSASNCTANQLTGFCVRARLALSLIRLITCPYLIRFITCPYLIRLITCPYHTMTDWYTWAKLID